MDDSIPVHPTLVNILDSIKNNPLVSMFYQGKIPQIWEEIGLHDSKFHAEHLSCGTIKMGENK